MKRMNEFVGVSRNKFRRLNSHILGPMQIRRCWWDYLHFRYDKEGLCPISLIKVKTKYFSYSWHMAHFASDNVARTKKTVTSYKVKPGCDEHQW